MKKKIYSRLKMYNAVLEICKEHQTTWEEIPGFANTVAEFEAAVNELKNDASLQESIQDGVSMLKKEKLAALFERLMLVHAAMAIHAKTIDNPELLRRNVVTLTDLKRLNIIRLELHLKVAESDLVTYGPALESFGISEQMIQETIQMIGDGIVHSTRPTMSIIERHQLTVKLNEESSNLDNILNFRLDPLMRLFKTSNSEFFKLYFNARIVAMPGSRKANPESETGSPPIPDDPF